MEVVVVAATMVLEPVEQNDNAVIMLFIKPLKKRFVSCNMPIKVRVGRSDCFCCQGTFCGQNRRENQVFANK